MQRRIAELSRAALTGNPAKPKGAGAPKMTTTLLRFVTEELMKNMTEENDRAIAEGEANEERWAAEDTERQRKAARSIEDIDEAEMRAFRAGEEACKREVKLEDNPWPSISLRKCANDLGLMWLCGWVSAKADRSGDKSRSQN